MQNYDEEDDYGEEDQQKFKKKSNMLIFKK